MRAAIRRAALLAVFPLLLIACSRRQAPDGTEAAERPVQAERPGQPAEGGPSTPEPPTGEVDASREIVLRRQEPPGAAPPAAASPQEQEEQGLLGLPGAVRLPEDFRIGALADLLQPEPSARGSAQVARRFLDALVRGEVAADLIEPDRREDLARSLGYALSAGEPPRSYRIGAVHVGETDQARLNVRLFGAAGRAEGELYLQRGSGGWHLLDFQVQLSVLGEPYERPAQAFYPSIYASQAWGVE